MAVFSRAPSPTEAELLHSVAAPAVNLLLLYLLLQLGSAVSQLVWHLMDPDLSVAACRPLNCSSVNDRLMSGSFAANGTVQLLPALEHNQAEATATFENLTPFYSCTEQHGHAQ
jgi:hypothetical protein